MVQPKIKYRYYLYTSTPRADYTCWDTDRSFNSVHTLARRINKLKQDNIMQYSFQVSTTEQHDAVQRVLKVLTGLHVYLDRPWYDRY